MVYTSIFNLDRVFDDIVDTLRDSDFSFVVSQDMNGIKEINAFDNVDGSYDKYFDEDKNMYYRFALVNVSKDLIDLTKTGKKIEITIKASKETDKYAYVHKGIKFPKNKDVLLATIDVPENYNAEPIVTYENGSLLLKFEIKPEEKPKKLSIK